jgi:hypothetical protein
MSFALPFVRSASDAGAEARLSGLGLAAIAIALFALAGFSPAVLGDGDTFSHLATGEWIIAHGAAPRVDPFSHSLPGAPWVAHEWLSEVLLTLAFRLGGWSGVVLLTGAAAASAALIVGLSAARELRGAPLIATVGLGLGLMTASLLARPHMLALPLAAAWGAGLLAARDRGRSPPLALAALMTAWANMHGGFIFGLILIGPFALEALAEAPAGARLATARAWTLFGLASLAAALIDPYGVEALVLPFRLMGIESLSRISEWRPQDFSHPGTMELALLALVGLTLTRPFAMAPIRAALLVALVAMALQHSRHQVLLGILAPMLLARPIAAAVGSGPVGDERRDAARIAIAATVAAALALGAADGADRASRWAGRADLSPRSGPAGLKGEAGAQRIRVRRLSDLVARAPVHRRPRRTLWRCDAEPLRQAPGGRSSGDQDDARALRYRLGDLPSRRQDRGHPRPHAGLEAPPCRRLCGRPGAGGCGGGAGVTGGLRAGRGNPSQPQQKPSRGQRNPSQRQ